VARFPLASCRKSAGEEDHKHDDLALNLLGQIVEGDRKVVAIELDGGAGDGDPAGGPALRLLAPSPGLLGDASREASLRHLGQAVRIGVVLKNDPIGVVDARHDLAGELADAGLVVADLTAQSFAARTRRLSEAADPSARSSDSRQSGSTAGELR
jgi:hypothetical protein